MGQERSVTNKQKQDSNLPQTIHNGTMCTASYTRGWANRSRGRLLRTERQTRYSERRCYLESSERCREEAEEQGEGTETLLRFAVLFEERRSGMERPMSRRGEFYGR